MTHLRGHSTPEVGIGCTRFKHGRDDGLVLLHELPEHVWVGEEIITVDQLRREERAEKQYVS